MNPSADGAATALSYAGVVPSSVLPPLAPNTGHVPPPFALPLPLGSASGAAGGQQPLIPNAIAASVGVGTGWTPPPQLARTPSPLDCALAVDFFSHISGSGSNPTTPTSASTALHPPLPLHPVTTATPAITTATTTTSTETTTPTTTTHYFPHRIQSNTESNITVANAVAAVAAARLAASRYAPISGPTPRPVAPVATNELQRPRTRRSPLASVIQNSDSDWSDEERGSGGSGGAAAKRTNANNKIPSHRKIGPVSATGGGGGGQSEYRCGHCNRSFSRNSNLTRHLRIHSGEKRFPCSQCRKEFMEKHHLMAHERIHFGIKPFGCAFCKRQFTDRSNLVRHEKLHAEGRSKFELDEPEIETGELLFPNSGGGGAGGGGGGGESGGGYGGISNTKSPRVTTRRSTLRLAPIVRAGNTQRRRSSLSPTRTGMCAKTGAESNGFI